MGYGGWMSTQFPPEDLPPQQLLKAYKELEERHREYLAKAAEEMASLKATHFQEVSRLNAQYTELEKEHKKFKTLHAKNSEIFLEDYAPDERLGFYKSKKHPEWGFFCGNCLPKGIAAHVRRFVDHKFGPSYECNCCGKRIDDPDNPPPPPPPREPRRNPRGLW
jgi:hypothetical protein